MCCVGSLPWQHQCAVQVMFVSEVTAVGVAMVMAVSIAMVMAVCWQAVASYNSVASNAKLKIVQ